jgi:hypothetical protein
MRRRKDVKRKLLACLDTDVPTPEAVLYERLARPPLAITDEEEARAIVQTALADNEIRWVAFTGYLRGGRP